MGRVDLSEPCKLNIEVMTSTTPNIHQNILAYTPYRKSNFYRKKLRQALDMASSTHCTACLRILRRQLRQPRHVRCAFLFSTPVILTMIRLPLHPSGHIYNHDSSPSPLPFPPPNQPLKRLLRPIHPPQHSNQTIRPLQRSFTTPPVQPRASQLKSANEHLRSQKLTSPTVSLKNS